MSLWGSGGTSATCDYDNFFIWDTTGEHANSFLGPKQVITLRPNSDEPATDWVRNAGTADWDMIDDAAPDADGTFLAATADGNVSEFGLTDLPAGRTGIVAVMPLITARNTGLPRRLRASLLSGAAVADGAEHVIPGSYVGKWDPHYLDPATGLPWTEAGVNAARLRLARTG